MSKNRRMLWGQRGSFSLGNNKESFLMIPNDLSRALKSATQRREEFLYGTPKEAEPRRTHGHPAILFGTAFRES